MKHSHTYLKSIFFLLILCLLALFAVACGEDVCEHAEVTDAAVAPTCYQDGKTEGKHCSLCGEITVAQTAIPATEDHDFSATWVNDGYYHWKECQTVGCPAIDKCGEHQQRGDSYTGHYCTICSISTQGVYTHASHSFDDRPYFEYIVTPASGTASAVYYKSCSCGLASDQTFCPTVTNAISCTPHSPTVTLYDTASLSYGFTWNCDQSPLTPVLEIRSHSDNRTVFYTPNVQRQSTFSPTEQIVDLYVCKAVIPLQAGETYTYRIADLCTGMTTESATFCAVDPNKTSFTFASISDSQDASGVYLGNVLSGIGDVDFYLHTGDICEDTKHEQNWQMMLDDNRSFLMTTPMMITAGNHDTTYKSGSYELVKHFNNNIPSQQTNVGYFYRFDYGNTRFIILNTNTSSGTDKLSTEQYNWLIEALSNNPQTWTIVSMHCPMYSVGKWGSNPSLNAPSLALRAQLTELFAQYGVDLVIQGHDHTTSKTHPIGADGTVQSAQTRVENGITYTVDPSGVIYIMNGPAGTQSNAPQTSYETQFYDYAMRGEECSWAEYTIDGNRLTVTVKRYNVGTGQGTVYASFGIVKS